MSDNTAVDLVSADSHVIEPGDLFAKRLPAKLADQAPKLGDWNGGSAWFVEDDIQPVRFPESAVTGSGYRERAKSDTAVSFDEVMPALYDPAERIKAQDADSVSAEVLYSFPYLWDAIKQVDSAELRVACARAYNDWLAEYCAHDPGRLIGVAKIPTGSIEDAAKELARCVDELHFKAAVLDAWPEDSNGPSDPALDAIWEVANQARIPVSLHFGLGDARSAPTSAITAGNKPPVAAAVLPLVASGVFDRNPELRMVFAHTDAGWAFHWMEFGDNMYLRQRHLQHFKLARDDVFPSDYTRRHFWFTIQQDKSALRLRHILGSDHLMWASHFPLDASDWPDNRTHAVQVAAELPPEEQRTFLGENAARLYRLPGYEDGIEIPPFDRVEKLVYF